MSSFSAVVLICTLSTPPSACNEANAVDVIATKVNSELGCSRGWQEIVARGGLKEGIGSTLYVKSTCRRLFARPASFAQ